jgi:hypothetical protein
MPRFPATVTALAACCAALGAPANAASPPSTADCVAQYVHDFQTFFANNTIGELQGQTGVTLIDVYGNAYPIPSGQAHTLQPFGVLLKMQASAAHDGCPFVIVP